MLKILCQFASERKSVPAEFFLKLNSFAPEQKAKKLSVRFCLQKS